MNVGLVRYPTTLAPVSGSVTIATQCADNAHVRTGHRVDVRCASDGIWLGTVPQCECNVGYHSVSVGGILICQGQQNTVMTIDCIMNELSQLMSHLVMRVTPAALSVTLVVLPLIPALTLVSVSNYVIISL